MTNRSITFLPLSCVALVATALWAALSIYPLTGHRPVATEAAKLALKISYPGLLPQRDATLPAPVALAPRTRRRDLASVGR